MLLTTHELRNNDYGTACGTVSKQKKICMSQPIIVEYIDDFFGGQLNVEVDDFEILEGSAIFSKEITDQSFYDKYVNFLVNTSESYDDIIAYIADYVDIERDITSSHITNHTLTIAEQKQVICYVFCLLIDHYDGSLRVDWYEGDLEIELESE